jgi:hypothetical protein
MDDKTRNVGNFVGAIVLIGLGIVFLLAQFFRIRVMDIFWPAFVILPGLAFFVGMLAGGRKASDLAIPGTIITSVGLLLFFMNLTGYWQGWAYAWALVGPTAVGLGLIISGVWGGQPKVVREGKRLVFIGLILFVAFGAFFELVIGLGGHGLGQYGWPLALIGLGILLLLRYAWSRGSKGHLPTNTNAPRGQND